MVERAEPGASGSGGGQKAPWAEPALPLAHPHVRRGPPRLLGANRSLVPFSLSLAP